MLFLFVYIVRFNYTTTIEKYLLHLTSQVLIVILKSFPQRAKK